MRTIKQLNLLIISIFLLTISFYKDILSSTLNGTSALVYKNQHHVFSNNENATGFVRMNGGFTIKAGAKATLDTVISVSGSIDLKETGIMQLLSDLTLDSRLSWSSGGYINGRGKSIFLNDTLSIPSSKTIHIVGDTIIDGCGQSIVFNPHANISVENNATLTLRNLIIKNTRNHPLSPCFKVSSAKSKLALDNVEVSITGDMIFGAGQLYIHNDVVFSGTSAFIYHSIAPCFVAPLSTFTFDIGTTFSFAPATTLQDLFVLQDRTSSLYLNGCTLKTTDSGMRLTRGKLIFDNKVTVETNAGGGVMLSRMLAFLSKSYGGTGSDVQTIAWHPSGNLLAFAGDTPGAVGSFPAGNELHVYRFDGTSLSEFTSLNYGTNNVDSLAWHPSGNFLTMTGDQPTSGNEVQIYRYDGSSLTLLTSVDYGASGRVRKASWNPTGSILMVGGQSPGAVGGFTANDHLRLYTFNGSTLTALVGKRYGTSIYSATWNPAGTVIAVGGTGPVSDLALSGFANTHELRLYTISGSTLTALTSKDYGTRIDCCAWNPDGTILAIGGTGAISVAGDFENTDLVRLYSFNGSTLTKLTSIPYSTVGYVATLEWNADGSVLAVGGGQPTNGLELQLFDFNGTSLTSTFSVTYGSLATSDVVAISWNPDGTILTISGGDAASGGGSGFSNLDNVRMYKAVFTQVGGNVSPQALSRSLVFGNSALGSNYDLNVEVLGRAHVTIDGKIVDDSA